MNVTRRHFVGASVCVAVAPSLRAADPYPSRPISVVVPFSPGGNTDLVARLIAANVSEQLGQTVLVENKPGAGGSLGSAQVAKAAPDGYTLLVGTLPTQVFNTVLYKNLPYKPAEDLVPITMSVHVPLVLATPPGVGVKSVGELLAKLRKNPSAYNFCSAGNGTASHLAASLFLTQADIEGVQHIPYKGSGPAIADLLAGRITFIIDSISVIAPHVKAGKLVGLAVAHPERIGTLPDVPTMGEAGMKEYEATTWNAWFAPTGTPKEIVDRLAKAVNAAHEDPKIKARLATLGTPYVPGFDPQKTARFIASEYEKWVPIVRRSGARLD